MARELEVERKFTLAPGAAFPDLAGSPLLQGVGVAGLSEPTTHELRATYFDTPDLSLLSARVTLRRRTGGNDAGWHVKLPAGGQARRELRRPLGRSTGAVPRMVLEPLLGLLRGRPVVPVATVHTQRTVRNLLSSDGSVLAELADDQVVGTALRTEREPEAYVQVWRELEVELVDGGEEVLATASQALVEAGITGSDSASKLARVLARGAEPVPDPRTQDGQTGQELVLGHLTGLLRDLARADIAIRVGETDGVHQFRVTCRRIRSILREYRSVLRREQTDPLRAELAWIGAELSYARDAEVVLEHLLEVVEVQPQELVLGPIRERLRGERDRAERRLVREVHRSLSGARYLCLRADLDTVLSDPPLAGHAGRAARKVAAAALRDCSRRMRRRVGLVADTSGHDHDAALHEVRKAAKTLRYTAEAAETVRGRHADRVIAEATRLREGMKQVQEHLGNRQDTVVSRQECLRLGAEADAAGESSWTYGRLFTLEEARATTSEARFWGLWDELGL